MSYRNDFEVASSQSPVAANTLLWQWLQSGTHRANLYSELRNSPNPILEFHSRITLEEDESECSPETLNQTTVYLLSRKDHIEQAFNNFSSDPYKALAPGYPVVLASDNNEKDRHELKRKILSRAFMFSPDPQVMAKNLGTVIGYSCHHAMILSRQIDNFDFVANIAEEASLFFVEGLYGIHFSNHPVLHDAMEAIYNGMAYQMLARHFTAEPGAPMKALMGEAALVQILDSELSAAMNPKLMSEISDLLARCREPIKSALTKLVDEVSALGDPALDDKLVENMKYCLGKDQHIAFHANQFIDKAMNLASVRVWVDNKMRGQDLDDEEPCRDEIRKLIDLIRAHKAEKEAPDDNLIPIRSVDEKGNYTIRDTVISRLAADPTLFSLGDEFLSGSEFLNELAGAISGTVGNFISSSSIALTEILKNNKGDYFREGSLSIGQFTAEAEKNCNKLIMEALRFDPPAPFLPRLAVTGTEEERTFRNDSGDAVVLKPGANVLIPMGSLTHAATSSPNPETFDEERDFNNLRETYRYVFGQAEGGVTSHRCIGDHMALPFVRTLLQSVFTMHGLAFENEDKLTKPLQKKWGFVCEKLPLTHKSGAEIKQQPLNVVMKIKTPIAVHAEYLKKIVYYGAPVVENLLATSNVVHDARFVIMNDDTELALITTYDGGYVEYLEYFAEQAGPLFDMIFLHIQDAPPMPVRDNVQAFADHIARYDIPPLAGYFYSAYPQLSVAEINKAAEFAALAKDPEISKLIEKKRKEEADKLAQALAKAQADKQAEAQAAEKKNG